MERGRNPRENTLCLSTHLILALAGNRHEGFGIKLNHDSLRSDAATDGSSWKILCDGALHRVDRLQDFGADCKAGLDPTRKAGCRGQLG